MLSLDHQSNVLLIERGTGRTFVRNASIPKSAPVELEAMVTRRGPTVWSAVTGHTHCILGARPASLHHRFRVAALDLVERWLGAAQAVVPLTGVDRTQRDLAQHRPRALYADPVMTSDHSIVHHRRTLNDATG
jgi:hypothetical protein